jgi:hypothetical protein
MGSASLNLNTNEETKMKKTLITIIALMISVNVFAIEEVQTDCKNMIEGRDAVVECGA